MIKKRKYLLLREAKTKPELAAILGVSASFLTKVLYKPGVSSHYHQFDIKKRSGGMRIISAPSAELKDLQKNLSILLLDCLDVLRHENKIDIKCLLSHGFERNRSIYSNASVHKNKRCVLNLDLEDFFGSFNFGRVRGYFISNRNFQLDPHIATVIAQIACFQNKLPQGSPCSPVISNLIAGSLDIRLSRLARRIGCSYSRYADDITFSSRKRGLPRELIADSDSVTLGAKLLGEVRRAGFSVNHAKTRLQLKNSRQEATGLIIMHVPAHSDHPFRFNPITDFGLIRSPISELSDQK